MSRRSIDRQGTFEMQKESKTMTTAFRLGTRRGATRTALAAVVALVALVAVAGSASAKTTHIQEGTFGPFQGPSWLGIDNSGGANDGDIWLTEISFSTFETSVFKLNEDGSPAGVTVKGFETPAGFFSGISFETFQASSGARVNNYAAGAKAGYVYVPDVQNKVIDVFDTAGTYVCQITGKATPTASECAGPTGSETPTGGFTPLGVAIDPSNGDVAVGHASGRVYIFNEAGEYQSEIQHAQLTEPGSLAFDSVGNLHVTNGNPFFGGGTGIKFDSSNTFVGVIDSGHSALGVGVDLSDDRVYFSSQSSGVWEYDSTGALKGNFANGETYAVDANKTNNKVYEVEVSGTIWSGPVTIPTVTVEPATNVEATTATVNGEVDPDGGGDVESCQFEYGPTTAYGSTAPCSPATPYAAATSVSANLTGLNESTTYHYRIVANNANGINSASADQTFITKGPPTIESQSVSDIMRFSAKFNASINPHGYPTDYHFEYVTQQQYNVDGFNSAQTTPIQSAGSGEVPTSVSQEVTGLTVGTTYHFRVIADNTAGDDTGPDQSFTTVPIADIEGQFPEARIHTARLEADINPLGLETSCSVEWVGDAAFQASGYATAQSKACSLTNLGSGSDRVEVFAEISGLEMDSTYHFRFAAQNSSGTLFGPDKTFVTWGLEKFNVEVIDDEENPETRAGARPHELVTEFEIKRNLVQNNGSEATGLIKDVLTELPAGLIGNPNAVDKCLRRTIEETKCTGDAQVGLMRVGFYGGNPPHQKFGGTAALYNMIPAKGKAASFGTREFIVSVNGFVDAGIRTGDDYGINAGATNILELGHVVEVEVRMWGVPADPQHDAKRQCGGVVGCASNAEPKPFLRMPTSCTGPLTMKALVTAWADPSKPATASRELPAIEGCNQVEFEPSIEARPTTDVADSPTGLHVDISNPQNEDPEGLGVADLRDAVVTLPKGIVINPSGANGLVGCTETQADLDSKDSMDCPDNAKVGTVEIDSPLVDHPLVGGAYVATPYDNPFGSLVALYLEVDDAQTGVIVKLAGEVKVDPESGQLTSTFKDNPQLPFNHFEVDFFGGALAPLKTPGTCGTFTTTSVLTPWSAPDSGPPAEPSDSYQITKGPNGASCVSSEGSQSNQPGFDAGTTAPIAGAYSPFVVNLRREDGTQQFSSLTVNPPPGLLGKLAGIPYCPEAAIAAASGRSGADEKSSPSCPAASHVGIVNVAAGAGPAPYYVQGQAYLAGPYKGAPLSLVIITPAAAGPFDLGTVVTRAAMHVNPETTQLTVEADPIPTILEGIPLNIRSISVRMDRPGFTVNPTSCDPMAVNGLSVSALGQPASLSARFQLGDCTVLGFKPKLVTRLFGATGRRGHPKLRAVLRMPGNSANIRRASVALPRATILDQSNIGTVCTRVQFAQGACPPASVYGFAEASSPLLDQPLGGPVYLRSSSNKLPDLVADLHGQVHVALVGRIDTVRGGLRTTFEAAPDAPVSRFILTMKGGRKGLLQNSTNLCHGIHRAVAQFDAHSGDVFDSRPVLRNGKCRKQKRRAKRRAKRSGTSGGALSRLSAAR